MTGGFRACLPKATSTRAPAHVVAAATARMGLNAQWQHFGGGAAGGVRILQGRERHKERWLVLIGRLLPDLADIVALIDPVIRNTGSGCRDVDD